MDDVEKEFIQSGPDLGEGEGPPPDNDNDLFGILQQEFTSTLPSGVQDDVLNEQEISPIVGDLLDNAPTGDMITTQSPPPPQHDLLTEEWDEYSTLDSKPIEAVTEATTTTTETSRVDWTDDLVEAEQPSRELREEIDELMACDFNKESPSKQDGGGADKEETMFDPLLQSVPSVPLNDFQSLFLEQKSIVPSSQDINYSQLVPSPMSALIPPVFPSPVTQTTPSYSFNSGRGGASYKPIVGGEDKRSAKDDHIPGQKWENLFAHLDPIANEKA